MFFAFANGSRTFIATGSPQIGIFAHHNIARNSPGVSICCLRGGLGEGDKPLFNKLSKTTSTQTKLEVQNGVKFTSKISKPRKTSTVAKVVKEKKFEIKLVLTSRYKFAAVSSFPPKQVTEMYKKLMGKFESEHKRWVFPLCQYYKLVNEISRMNATEPANSTIGLIPVPDNVFKVLKNDPAVSTVNHSKAKILFEALPLTVTNKLLPFQRDGVLFGLAREGRVLIGDEMGLGKTVQAIAIAAAYLDEWPLLIVCPSSMRCMWSQEMVNWLPGELTTDDVNTIYNGRDAVGNHLVTVISYDLFCKFAPEISAMNFKVMIADESHYLKNPNAKRSKTILPYIRSARRAILLTGTPALSRPVELFNLLNSLHPRLFNNFLEFAHRYCDARQGPFGLETSGASNLEELHVLLDQHSMVRRLKKDVLTQLPSKRRQKILIKISDAEGKKFAAEMSKLKELERVSQDDDEESEARYRAQARRKALIMKMYVDTGAAKLQAIQEYVSDLIECGAKFLVRSPLPPHLSLPASLLSPPCFISPSWLLSSPSPQARPLPSP
eukprot:749710-Hanusia_phi.AAC.2